MGQEHDRSGAAVVRAFEPRWRWLPASRVTAPERATALRKPLPP